MPRLTPGHRMHDTYQNIPFVSCLIFSFKHSLMLSRLFVCSYISCLIPHLVCGFNFSFEGHVNAGTSVASMKDDRQTDRVAAKCTTPRFKEK